MGATSKPQYRTLVSALGNLCNAVHDELENAGGLDNLGERRRRLRRSMERAEELVIRAEAAMAAKVQRAVAAKQRKEYEHYGE